MEKINIKQDKFGFYPVIKNSDVLSIHSDTVEMAMECAKQFKEEITEQLADLENNYGLLYYRCGFNGDAQTSIQSYWRELGVNIF